jgi:hypothetical protein
MHLRAVTLVGMLQIVIAIGRSRLYVGLNETTKQSGGYRRLLALLLGALLPPCPTLSRSTACMSGLQMTSLPMEKLQCAPVDTAQFIYETLV